MGNIPTLFQPLMVEFPKGFSDQYHSCNSPEFQRKPYREKKKKKKIKKKGKIERKESLEAGHCGGFHMSFVLKSTV